MSDGYFKSLDNVPVSKLYEHPQNAEYYSPMDETMWEVFLSDIAEYGITTPIKYNTKNGYVISGNQRLRAALELGFETIPALGVYLETEEDEIIELIRDNDIRRKDTLGNKLRRVSVFNEMVSKRRQDNPEEWSGTGKTRDYVKNQLRTSTDVYSLAIQLQRLDPEDQKKVMENASIESATVKSVKQDLEKVNYEYRSLEKEQKETTSELEKLLNQIYNRYGIVYDWNEEELVFPDQDDESVEKPEDSEKLKEEVERLRQEKEKADLEYRKAVSEKDTAIAQRNRTWDVIQVFKKLDSRVEALYAELGPVQWDEETKKEHENETRQFLAEVDRVVKTAQEKMLPGGGDND